MVAVTVTSRAVKFTPDAQVPLTVVTPLGITSGATCGVELGIGVGLALLDGLALADGDALAPLLTTTLHADLLPAESERVIVVVPIDPAVMISVELLRTAVATLGSGSETVYEVPLSLESVSGTSAICPEPVKERAEPDAQLPLTPTPRLVVPNVGPGDELAEGDADPLELDEGEALAPPLELDPELPWVLGKLMLITPGEAFPAVPSGGRLDELPPPPPHAANDAAIANRTMPTEERWPLRRNSLTADVPPIADSN